MKTVWVTAGTEADRHTLEGFALEMGNTNTNPSAIKIRSLGTAEEFSSMVAFLERYSGSVVFDLQTITLSQFHDVCEIMTKIDVLMLDIHEVEAILNCPMTSQTLIESAAFELLKSGVKSVYIRGEYLHEPLWIHDYWTNGTTSFWLTQRRYPDTKYAETGTIFSTAITSSLALGYSLEDAIVIAKMYVHRGMRLAQMNFYHAGFPEDEVDIPYLASAPLYDAPQPFKRSPYLGLYPVVDSADWVAFLLQQGVTTIQLRIKERTNTLMEEMKRSISLAKKYQAILFINDHWDLALELDAEAIHLGQDDLDSADLEAIRRKGLLLGVSTYCYYEVARAHAICPSYVAIGPIYPTNSKKLDFDAQGIERLTRWMRTLNYPLVAIGGISLERVPDVIATGVSGVALISAITEATDPQKATQQLLNLVNKN